MLPVMTLANTFPNRVKLMASVAPVATLRTTTTADAHPTVDDPVRCPVVLLVALLGIGAVS
jgi:hypothetical protein